MLDRDLSAFLRCDSVILIRALSSLLVCVLLLHCALVCVLLLHCALVCFSTPLLTPDLIVIICVRLEGLQSMEIPHKGILL
jgi:hypothetical protein